MGNLTSKNETLLDAPWFVLLLLTLLFLSLGGCWSNSKVTYVPRKEREQSSLQPALDEKKIEVAHLKKRDKVSLLQVLNEERTEAQKNISRAGRLSVIGMANFAVKVLTALALPCLPIKNCSG